MLARRLSLACVLACAAALLVVVTPTARADRNTAALVLAVGADGDVQTGWYGDIAAFGPDSFDVSGNLTFAEPLLACAPLHYAEARLYAGKIVITYRGGNCTFTAKAQNVQRAGATAMIVVNTEDERVQMSGDTANATIPAVMLSSGDGFALLRSISAASYFRLQVPRQVGFDGAAVMILLVAIGGVIAGAYASSSYEREQQRHRYQPVHERDAARPVAAPPAEVAFFDESAACGFIVAASVGLVTLYFFIDKLIYILIGLFAFSGAHALGANLLALAPSFALTRPLAERNVNAPLIGPTPLLAFFLLPPVTIVAVVWVVYRNSAWGWVLQDVMAFNLLVVIQRAIRIPNVKVCTILLCLAFVYDIFFVFATPVMIGVATGGGTGEAVPMLIRLPRLDGAGYSLLGLGDIALPGFLLSFLLRYDYSTATGDGSDWRSGFFVPGVCGYSVGLVVTDVALYAMNGHGQPALLYLVPCTLGLTLLRAYRRGKLRELWVGAGMPQDTAALSQAQAQAGAPQGDPPAPAAVDLSVA